MFNMQRNFYTLNKNVCLRSRSMLVDMRRDRRTTTEVVAANLRTLMRCTRGLNTPEAVALACRGKLTGATVRRLLKAAHPPVVETVAVLAEVFGVESWHLLYPDLDPQNLPVYVSDDERRLVAEVKAIIAHRDQGTTVDDSKKDRRATDRPVPERSKDKDHHN